MLAGLGLFLRTCEPEAMSHGLVKLIVLLIIPIDL